MLTVIDAKYIEDFKLLVTLRLTDYTTHSKEIISGEIDLKNYLAQKAETSIFAPLKTVTYFQQFMLNANTIEWQNGADIAPERLLSLMQPHQPSFY